MIRALSPRRRQALALLLLLAAIAALWAAAINPVIAAFQSRQQSLAETYEMTQRYKRIAASRGEIEQQLAWVLANGQAQGASRLIQAGSIDIAGAELQTRAKTEIEAGGGTLRSTQILPSRPEGAYATVPIRVQWRADIAGLMQVLYRLESAEIDLFFDNIAVRAPTLRQRSGASEETIPLDIRFDIIGYMRAVAP